MEISVQSWAETASAIKLVHACIAEERRVRKEREGEGRRGRAREGEGRRGKVREGGEGRPGLQLS